MTDSLKRVKHLEVVFHSLDQDLARNIIQASAFFNDHFAASCSSSCTLLGSFENYLDLFFQKLLDVDSVRHLNPSPTIRAFSLQASQTSFFMQSLASIL